MTGRTGAARLGIWAFINHLNAADCVGLAQRVEAWGYGTLWIPEAFGRDPFVAAASLLASTQRLDIATGIANIYARDSLAMLGCQYGLAEQSGGRFLLGLGVSHIPLVEGLRGHIYAKPIPAMQRYLERMADATYTSPAPLEKPRTVLAALGPKMLELAASHADGAHPYNVTPDHTAKAREILGPGKLLCPEQMVLLETDASTARRIARSVLSHSLGLPNYRNNFLRLGFTPEEIDHGGSDRLIDAIVAWGDEDAIRDRIRQHWDAGADQVCVQSLPREGLQLRREDEKIFELLAPARD